MLLVLLVAVARRLRGLLLVPAASVAAVTTAPAMAVTVVLSAVRHGGAQGCAGEEDEAVLEEHHRCMYDCATCGERGK